MGCAGSQPDKGTKPTGPHREVKKGGIGHAQFIIDNPGRLIDYYDVEKKKLGEGSYGYVCKATNKACGSSRAVKAISKARLKNPEKFRLEIQIMKMMDHPNIIKLFESFEDHRQIYLIMELCAGGELFDRIIESESGHFKEVHAAMIMQQILRAVYYMHSTNVAHRDLKPENFLFTTKDPIDNNYLKIIDFGLSCQYKDGQSLMTKAGTPFYVAPQVLLGKYDQAADLWSCGVIMFVLLCGYPPFAGETDEAILAKVKLGNLRFSPSDWKNVSEDAKQLIRALVKMNPRERFTAKQALDHDWIKHMAPRAQDIRLSTNVVDNLRGFRSQNKLKKAALHIIAGQLHEDQIKRLRDVFMMIDSNSDGFLTVKELKEGLAKCGLKEIPPDIMQIMQEVDADGSGMIDYTEFLAATLDKRTYMKEDVCWSAFRLFDRNGDGQISRDELQQVLCSSDVEEIIGTKAIGELMMEVDVNNDGMIDFCEFMKMMKGKDG